MTMADTSTCRGCGEPIRWVLTVDGARMPLNPVSAPDGNVVPVTTEDGKRRALVLTGAELPAQEPAWVPHHRTCPKAGEYRRRKSLSTKRCRACGNVLIQSLVDAGEVFHEGCHPPADLRAQVEAAKTAAAGRSGEAAPAAAPELDLEQPRLPVPGAGGRGVGVRP